MSSNLPALPTENSPQLDPQILSQLSSWEDYVSYYLQLDEATTVFSWWKADLLLSLYKRFGGESIEKFSQEVNVPRGTAINYIRTARAFPPEARISMLSFSHHFVASWADSYNDRTMEFEGSQRFDMLEKASDDNWSTRKLKAEVDHNNKLQAAEGEIIPCDFCEKNEGSLVTYAFYSSESRRNPDKFDLHQDCYNKVLNFIVRHGN